MEMPRTTYNRAEVPLPSALEKRPGDPKYQYGYYAAVVYEEVQDQKQDGTETVYGYQITLINGHTFFVSNASQQSFQFDIGSNVDYQVRKSGATIIKTVDGRKM